VNAEAGRDERWLVPLAAAVLILVTSAPYVIAWLDPPAGTRFTGVFFYRDDFYQYTSFAEQARRGALVFRNKFDVRPHGPFVVNVEWWLAGVLGGAAGSLVAGFHLLRLIALAALVAGVVRLLTRSGLSGARRRWALALVLTGGGLGWWRLWRGAPGWQVPDVATGLYPFHQALSNVHALAGAALALWCVVLHLEWRAGTRARWPWLSVGWALALSRPYDVPAALLAVGGLALLDMRQGRSPRRLLELLWLAPPLAYYVFTAAHPAFAGWHGAGIDLTPPALEYVAALAPAALLAAVFGWRAVMTGGEAPRALALWAGGLTLLVLASRSVLVRQASTTLGLAVLMLAAVSVPARGLAAAVAALLPTSVFLFWRLLHPWPDAFADRDYFAAVDWLRGRCSPGDVAVAPTDLSLMIAGLTPCSVVLGHRTLTPHYAAQVASGRLFYDPGTSAAWRREYLESRRARFVVVAAAEGQALPEAFTPGLLTPSLMVWEKRSARESGVGDPGLLRLARRRQGPPEAARVVSLRLGDQRGVEASHRVGRPARAKEQPRSRHQQGRLVAGREPLQHAGPLRLLEMLQGTARSAAGGERDHEPRPELVRPGGMGGGAGLDALLDRERGDRGQHRRRAGQGPPGRVQVGAALRCAGGLRGVQR
jgi:hypothetical protein